MKKDSGTGVPRLPRKRSNTDFDCRIPDGLKGLKRHDSIR